MAIAMQNNLRYASNYDAAYILADTQTVNTAGGSAAGKDSGGNATYVDLADYAGSTWVGHMRFTEADYATGDEGYTISIESSAVTNFATKVIEKQVTVPLTADIAASTNNYLNLGAFSPQRRYVRAYITLAGGTTEQIAIDKIWISPLG
jgi:hypothetical protein